MKYAYAIAIMINEEAYDIAKRFIDHLQERNKGLAEQKTKEKLEKPELEPKPDRKVRKKSPGRPPKYLEKIVEHDTCDNYEFIVDKKNDKITVKYKPGNYTFHFPFSRVRELYDALPEEFTTKDLIERAKEFGLQLVPIQAAGLIRVFTHVEFDAEIRRRGRQLMAVKMSDGYLREENRNKLKIEAETIGTPYKVES
jgi:hypothetical protein